jgi:hypothetical protein
VAQTRVVRMPLPVWWQMTFTEVDRKDRYDGCQRSPWAGRLVFIAEAKGWVMCRRLRTRVPFLMKTKDWLALPRWVSVPNDTH